MMLQVWNEQLYQTKDLHSRLKNSEHNLIKNKFQILLLFAYSKITYAGLITAAY
jgi:hypothetical protein